MTIDVTTIDGRVVRREQLPAELRTAPSPPPAVTRGRKVIERQWLRARQEADGLLERARREADETLEAARINGEALQREAEERIRQQGEEDRKNRTQAHREALEEGYREGLEQWQHLVLQVGEESRQALDRLRPQLLTLAVRTAARLLRQELEQRPDAVLTVVEGALETVSAKVPGAVGRFEIHVHPQDLESLRRLRGAAEARDHRWRRVELLADESLERGGCRVETEFGTVDCTVEAQSRVLMQRLEVEA